MGNFSYLSNADPAAIESLYRQFLQDPGALEQGWRSFFEGFEFARTGFKPGTAPALSFPDEFKVINLINAYRQRGHLFTKTNPVRTRRQYSPTLAVENFGLAPADLDKDFEAGNELGLGKTSLRNILGFLEQTYCQSTGVEYMYIRNVEIWKWLKKNIEHQRNTPQFSKSLKHRIYRKLAEAVLFEKFIHKKFPGQKSFSLEGCETLIPALEALIEKGIGTGNREFVIGMAHRGRLNVLANILLKPYQDIFSEFEGKEYSEMGLLGDVKYHLGYSAYRDFDAGRGIHLVLAPNPSHLEAVNAVAEGISRGRIDTVHDGSASQVTPVLIHGDASVAGQGIVYEVLQMSDLPAFRTGGTIHIVINNQLGFTTNYLDGRSSVYCTDVAKTIQCPVFHVNGDDVEAIVHTMQLAMDFRSEFHKDVFIDLLGYRKYGHNESDEPRYTQPQLYQIIESHPDPARIYLQKLTEEGTIGEEEAAAIHEGFNGTLEKAYAQARETSKTPIHAFLPETWEPYSTGYEELTAKAASPGVSEPVLRNIASIITQIPEDIQLFKKIIRLQQERKAMIEQNGRADWAMGELLAYGSLVHEGYSVRICGQDVERGTFSHRHAVMMSEDTGERYIPLKNIPHEKAKFSIYNSLLSEYGVLGFEYGYALAAPGTLTVWEAQFGDFANGAQIIQDQFISSAEEKWKISNGIVLLLPHGYDGQGPDHSSARLERYLTQCADNNMQVAFPTTPANMFHLLRRQMLRNFRKPLIVLTAKNLLRHPECTSTLLDFTAGSFMEVIDDEEVNKGLVKRVVFCTGKIFYELRDERNKKGFTDTALVRVEQLYPLPAARLKEVLAGYPMAQQFLWVQEEPANMGAWTYFSRNMKPLNLLLVARPESGSSATGSSKLHALRQRKVIEKTFGECNCERVPHTCKMTCAPKEWSTVPET